MPANTGVAALYRGIPAFAGMTSKNQSANLFHSHPAVRAAGA